jgi:hypothetical protein
MTDYELIEMIHVRRWVGLAPGEFSVSDASKFFLRGKYDNQASAMSLIMCLEGMVEYGELERVGNRRGYYRQPKREIQPIDLESADDKPVDIWLPFAMHKLVNVLPGNIITIGGEKNAGKTGYLLNLAFDNRNNFDVHYFNSEMGSGEIKLRCKLYCDCHRVGFSEWKRVNFYERSANFSDVIVPGQGNLNIIDFYEAFGDFWNMGEGIMRIHEKLDGAIAVIAIQKNKGNENPVGGHRVTEKSRVHMSISYNYGNEYPHKLKIDVGKNWADVSVNPRGMCVDYKLAAGCFLKIGTRPDNPTKHWYYDS